MSESLPRDAHAWLTEGERLLAARDLAGAAACLRKAEAAGADPDRCAAGRWTAAMLAGDFESAWRASDAIRARGNPDPHRFWQGEPLDGKRVIVRCLHGFGDGVQFLRYLPQLQSLASQVIVEVPPRLVELARHFRGAGQVITWGEGAPAEPPEWDVQVEIMELPYLFRTQLYELPIATGYLELPRSAEAARTRSNCLRVGLMWSAGSWDARRGIPFSTLQAILDVDGCEFWSLQHRIERDREAEANTSLRLDPQACESLMGLAQRITQLDLIITVDTVAAHLAGALGVEAWVLLQHEADWRWMHARADSPWYSTLRLIRQPSPGDWVSVMDTVCCDLSVRVALALEERAA